jgi:single stranded DNA-binding protein
MHMPDTTTAIVGNLTDDPEVRYTQDGIARAVFRVAVSGRREQEPSFFTVIVWRDQAEHASKSLSRGSRVVVVGRLQQRTWTAEDGGARSVVEVWPRSWGRASLVHLGGGACLECRRTPGAVGSSPPSLA